MRQAWEPKAIPAVVFTDPEIAWAGITETEAAKQGIAVEVARFRGALRAAPPRWAATMA
jgi:dihydrolipoamide dehydrogenase